MELSGTWRATVADEIFRRTWLDPEDGSSDGWEPIEVPGHWRSHPSFADEDGPILHRRTFEHPRPAEGERSWLRFDGLFYLGDVWLDGAYVGDTEGYFFPHCFEVTDALAERTEHVLGVELACPPQTDRTHKRNLTGVFQHSDFLDPDWNPGGIWRPVALESTGPIRIQHLRVVCLRADPTRADVRVRAVLDAAGAGAATIRTTVGESEHSQDVTVAGGENQLEWTVPVSNPRLWWPRALGDQPLEDVSVEVTAEGADRPSHRRELRTGLRQVGLRNWILSVNGERLFVKGANHGPARMALGEATPEEIRRDVDLAIDCGLDLLRVHAHVARPELYEAADETGLLLWQDMPLTWGYARGIRKQAVRQAREAVDLLGHHPSVVVWCGHDDPFALDVGPTSADRGELTGRMALAQELPTWNKTVLDRSIKRSIERADGSRPVIAHSGVLPHPPTLDGTDSHLWFGWYHGDQRDLEELARRLPRLVRWVGEFGAQAVPTTADFADPARWPDLDWERLGRTHGMQKQRFDEHVPPASHTSFEAWREASQGYQAALIKHHVETLRRLKYRPTGGFGQYLLADAHPAVSWSVLDHERVPKAGYAALRDACRPVIVVADHPPPTVAPGDPLALDVHVVSDLRVPIERATVGALLRWSGGSHAWRWEGAVGADDCLLVGTVQVVVPDAPGPLELELTLEAGAHSTTNRYTATVSGA